MPLDAPDLDGYWTTLDDAAPTFGIDEQRAAVSLYRELAKGRPLTADDFARAAHLSPDRADVLLASPAIRPFLYHDEHGRIAGFGGLAVVPMHHRLLLPDRELWTWCAWDGLFIPQILAMDARVESRDPQSGELVQLHISGRGALSDAFPANSVMSFLAPDASDFRRSADTVMTRFAAMRLMKPTRGAGTRWTKLPTGT